MLVSCIIQKIYIYESGHSITSVGNFAPNNILKKIGFKFIKCDNTISACWSFLIEVIDFGTHKKSIIKKHLIMNFPPFSILQTQRLNLRRTLKIDLEDILFLRSDQTVNKYIERSPAKTLKDTEDFFNKISNGFDKGKNINWTITFKDDDRMIGSICLWNFSEDKKIGEVGYDLKPQFHGQGIMTEALKTILNFGFEQLGLEKIEAFTHFQNESSNRVLIKNNFKIVEGKIDEYNSNNLVLECEAFNFK